MNENHEHVWGPLETSRFAGTVHRKCQVEDCKIINALDDDEEPSYKIVRMRFGTTEKEIIDTGLTLEEAQEHCEREDTHGEGWFDAYYEE